MTRFFGPLGQVLGWEATGVRGQSHSLHDIIMILSRRCVDTKSFGPLSQLQGGKAAGIGGRPHSLYVAA